MGPKLCRGLHPSGYEEVLVHNLAEVAKVDPVNQVARIGHTVGKKKRVQLIAEARKLNLTIVNVREVAEPVAEEAKPEPVNAKAKAKAVEKKKAQMKKEKKKKEEEKKKSQKKAKKEAEKQ